ncbi:rhodanese-like domain-containing protein [Sphingobacterium tabacisoli]|uniref:Rhodanese-like domain-containing protein n=1 Tax=Sphingobacterium tabacisoli TaxID=2044855 RepID=A0ABW5KXM0_9SPHI|nr:rhodanese-like domain-containing protein [Sphingobacterium tabacisoli]
MIGFIKKIFGNGGNEMLREALKGEVFLVDVRSPEEFASGSVSRAVNIPLGTLPAQLEKFEGKEVIVVFCRSGMRSRQAKGVLKKAGYHRVINGGAWQQVKDMVENRGQD